MCIYFNDTATTEIYTLSLHDALPICGQRKRARQSRAAPCAVQGRAPRHGPTETERHRPDRKSTRLNSSHANISYADFCLKKKKNGPTFYMYKHYIDYFDSNSRVILPP